MVRVQCTYLAELVLLFRRQISNQWVRVSWRWVAMQVAESTCRRDLMEETSLRNLVLDQQCRQVVEVRSISNLYIYDLSCETEIIQFDIKMKTRFAMFDVKTPGKMTST